MAILLLMRHGRAGFPEPGETDFDRALVGEGRHEVKASAAQLAALGLVPTRTICSTARRARETLEAARTVLDLSDASISFAGSLYSEGAEAYFKAISSHSANDVVMIVGHNPMIEDCALALCAGGDEDGLRRLRDGFPTGAVAVIALPQVPALGEGQLEQLIESQSA